MKTVAAYVRVSTVGQNEESQIIELRTYCQNHGLEPVFFIDKATGTNLARPALQRLENALFMGEFDTVLVYKIDRLSRSLVDGVALIAEWLSKGVRLVATSQRFDFEGTQGRMIASLLLSVAEMENEVRRERQAIGIANAKAKGVYKGRKQGTVKSNPEKAVKLKSEGKRLNEIAIIMGISVSTAQRYLRQEASIK